MTSLKTLSRRAFLSTAAAFPAAARSLFAGEAAKPVRIAKAYSNFERDALKERLGFKGSYMTEKWQIATYLESTSAHSAVGLCSQSVLWSDGDVFAAFSEAAGNALMYAVLDEAVQQVRGATFRSPIELLDATLPRAYEYAARVTNKPNLRETFALMSLVSLDNAAWLLYAKENGFETFDAMIPSPHERSLSNRHRKVASTPLISYGVPLSEIRRLVEEEGYFFLKIKIGQSGSQGEMLQKDMDRLEQIHRAVGHAENPYTNDGKPLYYLDANGRYERKETVKRLLDHAEKIGALDRIAVLEEPFPEQQETTVGDLGVMVVADESAHTDVSAAERIEMGYSAVAIKGAAKTLSMSLKVIDAALARGAVCFCADSAAIPILVDWNKNLAARLPAFPGLGMGLLEMNGHQHYAAWHKLVEYHPCAGASWTLPRRGVFELNDDFYRRSGGIFLESAHYRGLFPF